MKKDLIIQKMKEATEEANILTQRSMGYHNLFSAEVQAHNHSRADELRGLLHAILDQTLDANTRLNQLVHELYMADD